MAGRQGRIVVVGGVAAGMSAASQAKRREPETEVVVFERGSYVSYGACGIAYNIGDPSRSMGDLVAITPERFRERGLVLHLRHEVVGLDLARRRVRARFRPSAMDGDNDGDRSETSLSSDVKRGSGPGSEGELELEFDRLILATGASAARPPLPGLDLPGVFVLRELSDGAAIKRFIERHAPRRAVLVGGGYIGLEMVEALRARGIHVTVLEQAERLLASYEPEISQKAAEALKARGAQLELGRKLEAIVPRGAVNTGSSGAPGLAGAGGLRVESDGGALDADLVLVAVGVKPNVALAEQAGLRLGESGAIAVDAHQRVSPAAGAEHGVEGVYAAGDCAEALHVVTGRPTWVPLGTTANKQGRIAGMNATGGDVAFPGIVGTAGFKLFELEIARTGLGREELEAQGFDFEVTRSSQPGRGTAFEDDEPVTTVLFTERRTGRLLGAQSVGQGVVAKRIDVYATALHAGMTVDRLQWLDLSYAPPFAPVYDPVLIAGRLAAKGPKDDAAKGPKDGAADEPKDGAADEPKEK